MNINSVISNIIISALTALIVTVIIAYFNPFTKLNSESVENIGGTNPGNGNEIANFITNNPQVILDSVTNYQQKQYEDQNNMAEIYIEKEWNNIIASKNDPILGNPKGKIVVVEFFDYLCGYCKKTLPDVLKLVQENKEVKVILKEFPILSQASEMIAKTALAVHLEAPGKYAEFHRLAFEKRPADMQALMQLVDMIGLDTAAIQKRLEDPKIGQILEETRALALNLNVRGTPAFIINGKFAPGAIDYATMKELANSK